MSNTDGVTLLGTDTKYPQRPEDAVLECFDNEHRELLYLVPFVQPRDEFTSLCPKTGQPDVAKMEIIYVPDIKMIESKALKLYLFSFRNTGEFHEDVCNRIANDLFKAMDPWFIRVFGDFAPRGGLAIKPIVERWRPSVKVNDIDYQYIRHLITAWDMKK